MALKTRVALGIVLIMALSVIAVLPPRSCGEREWNSFTAMAMCGGIRYERPHTHQSALQLAGTRLRNRLARLELADSVRALVRAGRGVRSPDGAVVVLYEAPLTADSARVWLNLAKGELDRIPGGSVRSRVIVVLETDPATLRARRNNPAEGLRGSAARFASISPGDTACIVALRLDPRWQSADQPSARDSAGRYGAFLGACSLYARLGQPGAAVARGISWAFDVRQSFSRGSSAVRDPRAKPMEITLPEQVGYHLLACVKGDAAACPPLVGLGARGTYVWWNGPMMARRFFSYLLATRNPLQFQRFWSSPKPVSQALEEAYGRPHAELVRDWAQQDFVIQQASDAPSRRTMLLSAVGWFSVALLAAFALGVRRQVSP